MTYRLLGALHDEPAFEPLDMRPGGTLDKVISHDHRIFGYADYAGALGVSVAGVNLYLRDIKATYHQTTQKPSPPSASLILADLYEWTDDDEVTHYSYWAVDTSQLVEQVLINRLVFGSPEENWGSMTLAQVLAADKFSDFLSTSGRQIIKGTDLDDYIILNDAEKSDADGLGGNDTIVGGARRNELLGGAGNDVLRGEAGDDLVSGDRDMLHNGILAVGNDTVQGGKGNDSVRGMGGDDVVEGKDGDDYLQGDGFINDDTSPKVPIPSSGEDTVRGGDGDDDVYGGGGDDVVDGGEGNDYLEGDDNPARAPAITFGDDVILGGRGGDEAHGRGGDDWIEGDDGNDSLFGGDGDDTISGGAGRDRVQGDDGDDILSGNGGSDYLEGDDGNDTMAGGDASDTLYAGAGEDTIVVDADKVSDEYDGGGGSRDTLELRTMRHDLIVDLAQGRATGSEINVDKVFNFETVLAGGGNDKVTGNGAANWLVGWTGRDTLVGGGGKDTLDAGIGKDQLTGGAGRDEFHFVSRQGGADTITDFTRGQDKISLSPGIFGAIGATLEVGEFRSAKGATIALDGDDHLIYNKSTGKLYYDADGIDGPGGEDAVLIAILTNTPSLTAADFQIG